MNRAGACHSINFSVLLCFCLPPEKAHRAAVCSLQSGLLLRSNFLHSSLETTVAGLQFSNPIGVSAGFDKNAECYAGALAAGFGHIEIGTVTPLAQRGNPTPRVFRLPEYEAVINRLGFNNEGVAAAVSRLKARQGTGIVGGNIGKNKESVDAVADYVTAMRALYPHVDYITANISSPNTPGLRALQASDELRSLVQALHQLRKELVESSLPHKPIFVKIAPDCDEAMLEAIADVARSEQLDGLIISNTTISREAIAGHVYALEMGGMSGKPLFARSTEVLRRMYQLTHGQIPLIGVGGVSNAQDAYVKVRAGASLVQLYTALIYQGFSLADSINSELAGLLQRDGFAQVSDAVGVDAKA